MNDSFQITWRLNLKGDYDGWEAMGNPGWGYEDILPYFRKSEDNRWTFLTNFHCVKNWQQTTLRNPYLAADRRHHGVGGYLTVQVCKQDELHSVAGSADQIWITGASLEVTNCNCLCWGRRWDGLWEQVLAANAIHHLTLFDLNYTLHCPSPPVSPLLPHTDQYHWPAGTVTVQNRPGSCCPRPQYAELPDAPLQK